MSNNTLSFEDRLRKLTDECTKQLISLTLEFDPNTGKWHGWVDEDPEFDGDLDEVIEALEAEMNL